MACGDTSCGFRRLPSCAAAARAVLKKLKTSIEVLDFFEFPAGATVPSEPHPRRYQPLPRAKSQKSQTSQFVFGVSLFWIADAFVCVVLGIVR
jgi:hypothetical protein